ncbi:MAG TPA: cytochrome c3 family protein [Candidatus Binatia bacterium]
MKKTFLIAVLAAAAFVAMPLPGAVAAEAPDAKTAAAHPASSDETKAGGCVTSKCHVDILSKKNVHDPAEGCTDCHESVSTPHPAKGKKTFKLLNDVPDLCYTCHDTFGKKKTVHSPVQDGSCTDCHNPHSTAEEKLLIKPVGKLCKDCHDAPYEGPKLHGPVEDGDCTECHNPHETDTKSLLVKEGNALCFDCHTEKADEIKKKDVHAPVEDGCITCHDPHGSKFPAMLSEKVPKVCYSCHDTKEQEIKDAKVSHGALDDDKSCLLCHSPHASDNDALLEKPMRATCLECHDGDMPANAKFLHGKNHDGKCTDCHAPHGGDLDNLLVKEFPDGNYHPWNDKAYPLCFSCHERTMVTDRETTTATGFRDGKKNLHAVHVGDDAKGRGCLMCHSVHGSDHPKLIQDAIPFGKWTMKLNFNKTDTGGSCAPGCHRQKFYDRDKPGKKTAVARADEQAP